MGSTATSILKALETRDQQAKDAYQTRIRQANTNKAKKLHVMVQIEGLPCGMEMDTRSSLTIVSWATIRKAVLGIVKKDLNPQRIHLRDNQGNRIPVIVIGTFQVNFKKISAPLKITVVGGALPSRLSLDWFEALGMEVTEINASTMTVWMN